MSTPLENKAIAINKLTCRVCKNVRGPYSCGDSKLIKKHLLRLTKNGGKEHMKDSKPVICTWCVHPVFVSNAEEHGTNCNFAPLACKQFTSKCKCLLDCETCGDIHSCYWPKTFINLFVKGTNRHTKLPWDQHYRWQREKDARINMTQNDPYIKNLALVNPNRPNGTAITKKK